MRPRPGIARVAAAIRRPRHHRDPRPRLGAQARHAAELTIGAREGIGIKSHYGKAARRPAGLIRKFPRTKVGCQIPFAGALLPLSCPAGPARPGGELRTGKLTGNLSESSRFFGCFGDFSANSCSNSSVL